MLRLYQNLTRILKWFLLFFPGPPTAERKQLKRIVRVGEHLKLPCQISGSQPMSFEWKKDNEQIKTYAWPR